MTKKDSEAIAAQFAGTRPVNGSNKSAVGTVAYRQWINDVQFVALALGDSNPRFDRERLYRACGVEVS